MTDQAILFMVNEKMLKHGHVSEAVYDKIQQDIITGQKSCKKNKIAIPANSCYNLPVM